MSADSRPSAAGPAAEGEIPTFEIARKRGPSSGVRLETRTKRSAMAHHAGASNETDPPETTPSTSFLDPRPSPVVGLPDDVQEGGDPIQTWLASDEAMSPVNLARALAADIDLETEILVGAGTAAADSVTELAAGIIERGLRAFALHYDQLLLATIRDQYNAAYRREIRIAARVEYEAEDILTRSQQILALGGRTFDISSTTKCPAVTQANVFVSIHKLGIEMAYDLLAERKIMRRARVAPVVLEDKHVEELLYAIETSHRYRPPVDMLRSVLSVVAHSNEFHPVRDYLNALPAWDVVPRLDTWLVRLCGAKDTPFVRAVSRLVLVAAVRRARTPGCKFDEMLVLESSTQGTDKTTFVRTLCPRPEWFGSRLPLGLDTQTQMERTAGKWIVEAGELAGMGKADHNALKDYLSCQEDEARMAYGREPRRVLRHFVVIGTTNDKSYLKDPTGNRRYWPVEIARCDVAGLAAELDQLWREASDAEASGESIRLDPSLWGAASDEQEDRRVVDPFEYVLGPALEGVEGLILVTDAFAMLELDKPTQTESQRVTEVMAKLGWAKGRRRRDSQRPYCYTRGAEVEGRWISIQRAGRGWRCTVPAVPPS